MKWAIPVAATSGIFFDLRVKECIQQLQTVVEWESFCQVAVTINTTPYALDANAQINVTSSDVAKNYNLTIPLAVSDFTIIEIKKGRQSNICRKINSSMRYRNHSRRL